MELKVLLHLRDASRDHKGYWHVPQILDHFVHEGPHGSHHCFVFKPMSESLAFYPTLFPDDSVPNSIMKRFTKQLLLALQFAHSTGVIHNGKLAECYIDCVRLTTQIDIEPDNIFIKIKHAAQLQFEAEATEQGFKTEERPSSTEEENSSMDSGGPSLNYALTASEPITVLTQQLDQPYVLGTEVILGEWSSAAGIDSPQTRLVQPAHLRAPEILIGAPWDNTADLWSLGAVVMEVFRRKRMFGGDADGVYELKEQLREIIDLFGPFPRSLLEKGKQEIVVLFDEEGYIKDAERVIGPPLEDDEWMGDLEEDERAKFLQLLRSLMKVDPKERKDIADLLKEDWLAELEK